MNFHDYLAINNHEPVRFNLVKPKYSWWKTSTGLIFYLFFAVSVVGYNYVFTELARLGYMQQGILLIVGFLFLNLLSNRVLTKFVRNGTIDFSEDRLIVVRDEGGRVDVPYVDIKKVFIYGGMPSSLLQSDELTMVMQLLMVESQTKELEYERSKEVEAFQEVFVQWLRERK